MASSSSRFVAMTEEEISELKENCIPKNTKQATKFGMSLFTEWFQQQTEFAVSFEDMDISNLNKCLSKFYVSIRRKDGSYYKKSTMLSIRAALDRHLQSPPHNKRFSICDNHKFSEANKTLNSYLKHLSSTGKIAGTVHKNPLTSEVVQILYDKGQLGDTTTRDPRVLLQTAWFFISLYFGKRGRENQADMKKSMLRLQKSQNGEEYFELNRSEPGTVLVSKNHTGGLEGTEDHSDGKIFAQQGGSPRCPVEVLKCFLSHLNPDINALFQKPRQSSTKFNPESNMVWFEARKLGHNMLENMLKNMTMAAEITPYLTNHSMRATTVTVLSSKNIETRKIKAITGHRSDTSIESYCSRPTLNQFKEMSTALTSFVSGDENQNSLAIPASTSPSVISSVSPSLQQSYLTQQQENFLVESGINPGAILPSGSFHNCSFTFNINVNNNR